MANTAQDRQDDVIVIGAGIVGVTIAAYLQEQGRKVTLIDRKGVANESSFGNAGAFATSDILPLASPGMIKKAPKWLLDPLGPFSIRPRYLPTIMPWLLRFWRASWATQFKRNIVAQSALMSLANDEISRFTSQAPLKELVRHNGNLHLYESKREFDQSLPGWQQRADLGIAFQHLQGSEIAESQPGISAQFVAATFLPQWRSVADPRLFALAVWGLVERNGGVLVKADVSSIEPLSDGALIKTHDGKRFRAKQLVVAAGAWSHRLSIQLGDKIPLETERGYNTTLPVAAFDLKRQLTFGGHGFIVTPLSTGIRVGGAVEFAGLDAKPDYRRSQFMLEKARQFLPELDISGGTQWMGFRPSMPDSLPVIGRATGSPHVTYAFGHGHLGLTQSSATARLVSDLLSNKPSPIDITPFRANRF